MKQVIFNIVAFVAFTLNVTASSVFVNNHGNYTKLPESQWSSKSLRHYVAGEDTVKPGAPIYYALKCGYKQGEVYSHHFFKGDEMYLIFLKSFTKDVLYVYTTDDTKSHITDIDMIRYMENFDFYSDFRISRAVEDGVSKSFVMKFKDVKVSGNKIIDANNGFIYKFKGNDIVDVMYLDGFNEYAKEYQDHPIFDKIQTNAILKHSSPEDIIDEINFQFKCMVNIPTDMLELATRGSFDFNFAELYFVLERRGKLSDFRLCVPDAKLVSEWNNMKIYTYRKTKFYFKNNELFEVELPKV